MKKTYITPSVEEIKVAGLTNILTGSLGMNDKEVDTSNGGQLGREDNPSRPNIWEQGW